MNHGLLLWLCLSVVVHTMADNEDSVVMNVGLEVKPLIISSHATTLATCVVCTPDPPAEVSWDVLSLGAMVTSSEVTANSNDNGTITVTNHLRGVPSSEVNQKKVQCLVRHPTLGRDKVIIYIIDIHYPPQSVKITQKDDGYQCAADANPKPVYTWSREGHPLPSGVRAEGNRLYLDFIPELNGLYTCKASNSYGTAEGHHTLYAVTGASGRPLSVIIIISVIFGAILIIMLRKCIISRNQQETLKVVAKKLLQ
ncbi:poliovirus receptor homolog isoform X1 [Alosa sapidissima]|uniref:poliovirus receptor homolog isoform X1 n=1 Tax=Alosa sapidissima TaxID=34773 RepID=UPI001C09F4E7|nr:poliovirus receptor homolog isoform X1 [Alosa sapidissima]XP_041938862.1 poliovirus receptor homolog isoform X1 [Alosa sapidissima]XP_041938870.1 poliovirus receptor homolog isoform X1 [Alosa sapidissima]